MDGIDRSLWPFGPGEPPRPRRLRGLRWLGFYILNLVLVLLVVAPLMATLPLAELQLLRLIRDSPGLKLPLLALLGLVYIGNAVVIAWAANHALTRFWIRRLGWDEIRGFAYHDPLAQRPGFRKLNAYFLRRNAP